MFLYIYIYKGFLFVFWSYIWLSFSFRYYCTSLEPGGLAKMVISFYIVLHKLRDFGCVHFFSASVTCQQRKTKIMIQFLSENNINNIRGEPRSTIEACMHTWLYYYQPPKKTQKTKLSRNIWEKNKYNLTHRAIIQQILNLKRAALQWKLL